MLRLFYVLYTSHITTSSIYRSEVLHKVRSGRLHGGSATAHLLPEEEPAAHWRSVLVTHLMQSVRQRRRSAEEDAAIGVWVFTGDGIEYPVPLGVSGMYDWA